MVHYPVRNEIGDVSKHSVYLSMLTTLKCSGWSEINQCSVDSCESRGKKKIDTVA